MEETLFTWVFRKWFSLNLTTNASFEVAGSEMIKTLDLNVSNTKRGVAPKHRPDRFLSIVDHIQVTPTFEHT